MTEKAGRSLLVLTLVTLACLLPFVGKAFHIDDPLFIWTARQILHHPLDFYGFDVNWAQRPLRMVVADQNPPLASYYIAPIGALFGWNEIAVHVWMLLPTVAGVAGTWFLARELSQNPLTAALATLFTPAYIVAATSVMCDTMMTAFWVWAVYFWVAGTKKEKPGFLLASSLLIVLATLTKYYGAALIPLLGVYSAMKTRRPGVWIFILGISAAALATYELVTYRMYGVGLMSGAAGFATHFRVNNEWAAKIIAGLAFTGGCLILPLAAAPWVCGRRGLAILLINVAALVFILVTMRHVGESEIVRTDGQVRLIYSVQLAFWCAGGFLALWMAAMEACRQFDPDTLLLALWMLGTWLFACGVNWTVSGRNILPMAPAMGILLTRWLEREAAKGRTAPWRWRWVPLGLSLLVALNVAWADYRYANGAREAVDVLRQIAPRFSGFAFQGHWGFQYYMQDEYNARPLNIYDTKLRTNEAVVIPEDNVDLWRLRDGQVATLATMQIRGLPWLAVMDRYDGAGYYFDGRGPAPFAFCRASPQHYRVLQVLFNDP